MVWLSSWSKVIILNCVAWASLSSFHNVPITCVENMYDINIIPTVQLIYHFFFNDISLCTVYHSDMLYWSERGTVQDQHLSSICRIRQLSFFFFFFWNSAVGTISNFIMLAFVRVCLRYCSWLQSHVLL